MNAKKDIRRRLIALWLILSLTGFIMYATAQAPDSHGHHHIEAVAIAGIALAAPLVTFFLVIIVILLYAGLHWLATGENFLQDD